MNKYVITIRYIHPTGELKTMEIIFHGERIEAWKAAARKMDSLTSNPHAKTSFQVKISPYRPAY